VLKVVCKVKVIREKRKARNFQNSSFVDATLISLILGREVPQKNC